MSQLVINTRSEKIDVGRVYDILGESASVDAVHTFHDHVDVGMGLQMPVN